MVSVAIAIVKEVVARGVRITTIKTAEQLPRKLFENVGGKILEGLQLPVAQMARRA